jgi:3-keto-5-aminohexanoate cleavage enzyme
MPSPDSHQPIIINLALTGNVPTKEMTPYVPISVDEILDDAARCAALGASIIHVHARDESGEATHRKEYFAPIIEGIRAIDPQLIVCATCSGRFTSSLDDRADVLDLTAAAKPDMASLTLGSNNFVQQASVNSPQVIRGLALRMLERDIRPELEVFEPGMLTMGAYLVKKGLVPDPAYVNILLGNLGTSPSTPGSLDSFLSLIPESWTWAVAGIGNYQLQANAMGIASGGNVRVGLEDNIWWDRERTRLASNEMLVKRVTELSELMERPISTPAATRERLGLSPTRVHA